MQATVIGISLNSRLVGLAAIKNQLLLDADILFFEERWSKQKANRMLDAIIQFAKQHAPNCAAIMLPRAHHSTHETKYLIRRIAARFSKLQIQVRRNEADCLLVFCSDERAKKKALMSALVSKYPDELHIYQQKELQNKKIHYHKLFEAVGVATIVANQDDNPTIL